MGLLEQSAFLCFKYFECGEKAGHGSPSLKNFEGPRHDMVQGYLNNQKVGPPLLRFDKSQNIFGFDPCANI